MKILNQLLGISTGLLALALTLPSAQAVLLANEQFDVGFTSGSLVGQGSGTGWNGAWTNNQAGSYLWSTPGLDDTTGKAQLDRSAGNVNGDRLFSSDFTIGSTTRTTDTVFYGVTLEISTGVTGELLSGFRGAGSIAVGKQNANDNWHVYGLNAAGSANLWIDTGIAIDKGVETRFVMRLDYTNSGTKVTLWINPENESSTPIYESAANTFTATQMTSFRNSTFLGAAPSGYFVDNIQVATTFNEAFTVIPEPQTALLIGLSALGLTARRKARRS